MSSEKRDLIRCLIGELSELCEVRQRAVAAIVGSAVADAAARPLHWIYNRKDLEEILSPGTFPEFWPESKSPFYSLLTGSRSCYSHVLETGLEAVAHGKLDMHVVKSHIRSKFGPGTDWQASLALRAEAYRPEKRKTWRKPVPGPWLHGAVIHFLQHGAGADDNIDMDNFLLGLPYVVLHAEDEDVLEQSAQVFSLLSTCPDTLAIAKTQAVMLRDLVLGRGINSGSLASPQLGTAGNYLEIVAESLKTDYSQLVQQLDNNCNLPGSFQTAVHAVLTKDIYPDAIRAIIREGGCNCSRANYAGALIAARDGIQAIPEDWMMKTTEVEVLFKKAIDAAKNL